MGLVQPPRNRGGGLYLYYACSGAELPYKACVATSTDGIEWIKPKLRAHTVAGQPTNVVFPRGPGSMFETGGAFYDESDPERPFKLTGMWSLDTTDPRLNSGWQTYVFASANGLDFTYQHGSLPGGVLNHSAPPSFGVSDTGNLCLDRSSQGGSRYSCYIRLDETAEAVDDCPAAPHPDPTLEPGATIASRRIGLCETDQLERWCNSTSEGNGCTDKTV